MSNQPTQGPLPGAQWIPSNGTEGLIFFSDWCQRCQRDKAMREGADLDECDDNELCEIIAASYRGVAVEWREMPDGQTICTAFVEAGKDIPDPRCQHTVDMFVDAKS